MSTNMDELLDSIEWEDAVIVAIQLQTVTRVNSDGSIYAPGALPTVTTTIHSPHGRYSEVEIAFVACREIGVWFAGEMEPTFERDRYGGINWSFGSHASIECASIEWGGTLRAV